MVYEPGDQVRVVQKAEDVAERRIRAACAQVMLEHARAERALRLGAATLAPLLLLVLVDGAPDAAVVVAARQRPKVDHRSEADGGRPRAEENKAAANFGRIGQQELAHVGWRRHDGVSSVPAARLVREPHLAVEVCGVLACAARTQGAGGATRRRSLAACARER